MKCGSHSPTQFFWEYTPRMKYMNASVEQFILKKCSQFHVFNKIYRLFLMRNDFYFVSKKLQLVIIFLKQERFSWKPKTHGFFPQIQFWTRCNTRYPCAPAVTLTAPTFVFLLIRHWDTFINTGIKTLRFLFHLFSIVTLALIVCNLLQRCSFIILRQ